MEVTDPSFATANPASLVQTPSYLDRPEGRVAYEMAGDGRRMVVVPGMVTYAAPISWRQL